ncbi:hypothetical protein Slin15195_G018400 [Septoria linicola]|uniref:Uncharacterized protein n=1 Tax=Septoria linicola TaxID=215465 RepID=A0A9Q9APM1_9PEZI|nr:hypothetical protein Slin14017_G018470 [Septoria linicola]USW48521.1 hypothetical protein Slin15195_G018400 [Septoria linicola]
MRLATLVVFVLGSGLYAPAFYFSPDHPNWYAPAFVLAAAVPAIVVTLATGPMIHGIRVTLPDRVRRGGKDGLRRWSSINTPGETQLDLQYMRWSPWPKTRTVTLNELKRLKPSLSTGIANLEWTPTRFETGQLEKNRKEHPWYASLATRSLGNFYVKRDQKKDRAAVPGVWDGIWRQIPWKGEEGSVSKKSDVKRDPTPLRPVVPPQAPIGRP